MLSSPSKVPKLEAMAPLAPRPYFNSIKISKDSNINNLMEGGICWGRLPKPQWRWGTVCLRRPDRKVTMATLSTQAFTAEQKEEVGVASSDRIKLF
jgi:hypothetical protein